MSRIETRLKAIKQKTRNRAELVALSAVPRGKLFKKAGLRSQAAFRIAKRYCTIKIIGNMFLQTCLSDMLASQRMNRIQQRRSRR